ncbi:116 kDa U5 small nuclear ribonucleoprotein component [Hondaea fermentalgiana]|uniref:116 kDa U5 small nuclear ribonucleoprotein component n=1 Tax=Hondaea fermentalgiana TaxID=2315210 RepID=A0A2R5GRX0_9STRA|nr:116 kDa U5 small nuclear ribonucleoprotein component [Hondaea fermentalgiana]|eukprot:GBG31393.1 116 kDa U5 small nuclear ribonucleoprotein component [Hondaea fermentalgiana]
MSGELYDEFGNYIGPELDDSESGSSASESGEDDDDDTAAGQTQRLSGTTREHEGAGSAEDKGDGGDDGKDDDDAHMGDVVGPSSAIVLHEDKKYYPDADEVYPDAEVLVQDEDAQGIEEPLIKPVQVKTFSKLDDDAPNLRYSVDFLGSLMSRTMLIRNVAVLGHLHHGKSTLMDLLIDKTFESPKRSTAARKYARASPRYCDARFDEQERRLSIKSCPVTMALEDGRGKTFLINAIDCPGHIDFVDEMTAAAQAADGILLVVDAVEGPLVGTRRAIALAARLGLPLTLCVNKIDRLVHELKLPPSDAYLKLQYVIDNVNAIMREKGCLAQTPAAFSPIAGNVCFASGADGYCFTLESWARLHLRLRGQTGRVDAAQFAKRLWGDRYFDPSTRKFSTQAASVTGGCRVRSFVHFILQPLYKLYAQVLGEEPEDLKGRLASLKVRLTDKEVHLDPRPLLRLVMKRFFAGEATSGAVDVFVHHVPAPGSACNQGRIELACPAAPPGVKSCDATGPLRAHVCKLYASPDGTSFRALAKLYSGSLRVGQRVRVLGEAFLTSDQEDMSLATIDALSLCQARHRILVNQVFAGNWVLIEGLGDHIVKAATLISEDEPLAGVGTDALAESGLGTFAPLKFDSAAVMKLALEPVNPPDLPKMLHGLRCVNKSYPLLRTKVEESGEHVVFGTGEMYLDCVMQDLREMFAGVEIKVSDPMVAFCETVADTSAVKMFAETPNSRNQFTAIATPLEKGLGTAIERGALRWDGGPGPLGQI